MHVGNPFLNLIICKDSTAYAMLLVTYAVYTLRNASNSVSKVQCSMITLGAHAQRGYGSWVCVCVSVCMSVTQHLTFPTMFVCLTNDTTYLTGNEGQKF